MTPATQRIGIIGAGVSGMAAAWLLQDDHHVTLFDQETRLGGHAETVPVVVGGRTIYAELGPRFFFDPSYPYFLGLLRLLGVPIRWNDARVSVTQVSRDHTVVLPPRSPRHVLSLLRSPHQIRHLISLRRLISEQPAAFAARDFSVPFHRYLAEHGYPSSFGPEFAYPFLAACWGSPVAQIVDFPAYSLLKGMPPGDKAGFFEIEGGMARYMRAFGERLTRVERRLGAGIRSVGHDGGWAVEDEGGDRHRFDQLIVATSSRDAAALLRSVPAAGEMQAAIAGFRHFHTDIVVHGDPAYMPPNRKDWAHNNLFFDGELAWMSDWQGCREGVDVIRTWLPKGRPLPRPLYGKQSYYHLVMSPENAILQGRMAALQGRAGLWVTGMYTVDVDNHESALLSAVVPARALAPASQNLARFLGAVAPDAKHGLEVLPVPLSSPPHPAPAVSSAVGDDTSVSTPPEPVT
jgi:predicted NAD/FAD-binding protein